MHFKTVHLLGTLHAKRVTLMVPDIVLVRFILSMFNVNV
jgi:histone H3/H4